MLDRKVQMMDAGTGLFETAKPFGTVLGGLKVELEKYGKVLRAQEIDPVDLPETTGACDLFLDWSTPLRKRYIACRLEDAGGAGKTGEGEEIRRYAASFKEGNRNTPLRKICILLIAHIFFIGGIVDGLDIPRVITSIAGVALGLLVMYLWLKPSTLAQKQVRRLVGQVNTAGTDVGAKGNAD